MGIIDIVRLLLADPRINPAENNNEAIRGASTSGHVDVVRLLLANPRVNPTDDNNYSIHWASRHEYIGVVRLLLTDERVIESLPENARRFYERQVAKALAKRQHVL